MKPQRDQRTEARRSARRRACAIAALLALGALHAGAPRAGAQVDVPERWRTHAGGNEIEVVAVDPNDPSRVWVGTEGGGVVVWTLAYGPGGVTGDFVQILAPAEAGLRSNTIHDIAFDAVRGDVWLATDHGVTHVVGDTWTTEVDEAGMPRGTVYSAIAVQDDGTVWAGTPDTGLARRLPGGTWETVDADVFLDDDDEPREGPGSDRIADLALDNDGRLWVVHGRGGSADRPAVSRYHPDDDAWYHIGEAGPTGDDTKRPATAQILDVAVDASTGDVWLATWSRGVVRFDPSTATYTTWRERDPDSRAETGLCADTTWAIAAADGTAWVACGGQQSGLGVARFDGAEWTDLGTSGALGEPVTSIALAGEWALLGTDSRKNATSHAGGGLVPLTLAGGATQAEPLVTDGAAPQANEITAIAFDGGGNAWVGTNGSGLLLWDATDNTWQTMRWDAAGGGLPGDAVTDLLVVGDDLWVASAAIVLSGNRYVDGGVGVLDLTSGQWRDVPQPEPDGEPYRSVSSLAQLADGRIAMGLGTGTGEAGSDPQLGRGVAFLDPQGGTYAYDDFAATGGALLGDTVLDLDVDGTDLWAATSYFTDPANNLRRTGGGAARYDSRAWEGWGNDDAGFASYADELITGDVRSVHVAPGGDVWAGTWSLVDGELTSVWPYVDAVANLWDGAAWRPETFEGQGWVSAIVEDTRGTVWAGTTRGNGPVITQEYWPGDGVRGASSEEADGAEGGLRLFDGAAWTAHSPEQGGFPVRAITALAIEPATGYVWVGTESGGVLVYQEGAPLGPTRTPGPTRTAGPSPTPGPTYTPRPTSPPAVVTLPPTAIGPIGPVTATATRAPDREDEPDPPSEVPEASTWLLLAVGLAAVGGWWAWQRRHASGGGALAG